MDLIVHHWDADGICSASLIAKHLAKKDFLNVSPPVGEYRFDKRIRRLIKEADCIFVADLNVPEEIEKIDKRTVYFDHHIQPTINNKMIKQINPVINGERSPSCAIVVSKHINVWSAETVIGTVGDIGKFAFAIPEIKKVMKKLKMSENQAMRLAELINSNHISGNRKGVEMAVNIVLENDWEYLLDYEPWIKQTEEIEREVDRILSKVENKGNHVFLEFESRFNIISRVARALIWEIGFDEALVINSNFNGKVQLYYRISKEIASKRNTDRIISGLKNAGISVGGKDDVIGCIFEPEKLHKVIEFLRSYLRWLD